MGILEDVVINAKTAANVVGKKAGEFVDVSKLRINAADLNNEINKKFQALGRLVYSEKKEKGETQALQNECVDAIADLYEQLDAINAQLVAMRHRKVCQNCKKENPQEAVYCSACGTLLDKE